MGFISSLAVHRASLISNPESVTLKFLKLRSYFRNLNYKYGGIKIIDYLCTQIPY